jgi:hypothetical protein
MKYKVIKNIPNFNIGDIINTKDNLGFHPELYSDIFEKIVVTEIKTMDDFIVEKYDEIYKIKEDFTIVKYFADDDSIIFKGFNNALNYVISNIYLEIENDILEKEDIPLFGVCCKSNWQEHTTTSLELFQRTCRNVKQSESWKYFRTEEKKKNYIEIFKPMYCLNDIKTGNYLIDENNK